MWVIFMSETEVREFRTITKKTKALLKRSEDYEVDYKISVGGIESKDFVAFANSSNGGTILVGVDEINDENGFQKGKVVGCDVGDESKLTIINKATPCRPPVELDIIIENTSDKPIYRIDIPSGYNKPYCTNSGQYLIRHKGL